MAHLPMARSKGQYLHVQLTETFDLLGGRVRRGKGSNWAAIGAEKAKKEAGKQPLPRAACEIWEIQGY